MSDVPPGIDTLPAPGFDARPRTTIDFWDSQWNQRDDRASVQRLFHARDFGRDGHFLRLMRRYAPGVFKDAAVVELGGGASRYLVDLARHEHSRVTAIDYSDIGIRQTKELFALHGIQGDTILADIFEWHEADGCFDVVVHWGLLEHFDDPAPILAASARLLKPGGVLVFTMPNLAAVGAGLWRRFAPGNFSAHVYHSDESLRAAMKNVGLRSVRMFHCGPPLVRMAPAERGGLASQAANLAHALLLAGGTLAPSLYLRGHPRISNTRGFVARKI